MENENSQFDGHGGRNKLDETGVLKETFEREKRDSKIRSGNIEPPSPSEPKKEPEIQNIAARFELEETVDDIKATRDELLGEYDRFPLKVKNYINEQYKVALERVLGKEEAQIQIFVDNVMIQISEAESIEKLRNLMEKYKEAFTGTAKLKLFEEKINKRTDILHLKDFTPKLREIIGNTKTEDELNAVLAKLAVQPALQSDAAKALINKLVEKKRLADENDRKSFEWLATVDPRILAEDVLEEEVRSTGGALTLGKGNSKARSIIAEHLAMVRPENRPDFATEVERKKKEYKELLGDMVGTEDIIAKAQEEEGLEQEKLKAEDEKRRVEAEREKAEAEKQEMAKTSQPPHMPRRRSHLGKWIAGLAAVIGLSAWLSRDEEKPVVVTKAKKPPAEAESKFIGPPPLVRDMIKEEIAPKQSDKIVIWEKGSIWRAARKLVGGTDKQLYNILTHPKSIYTKTDGTKVPLFYLAIVQPGDTVELKRDSKGEPEYMQFEKKEGGLEPEIFQNDITREDIEHFNKIEIKHRNPPGPQEDMNK